jgi:hypothetical protein
MELFFRRRRIREKLNAKILPSVTNLLNAKTRGLDQLSLAKGDHYCAEVQDLSELSNVRIVTSSWAVQMSKLSKIGP